MKCEICNKETTHLFRCEEHYHCDICGGKENLCYRNKGLFCDKCHKKIAQKQVDEFKGDTSYEDEIMCPWCGYTLNGSWKESNEDLHICENCENEYTHTRDITVAYSTYKIDQSSEFLGE